MSDFDTLRWGDSQQLSLLPAFGETLIRSKELLYAKWQRPVVWRLMLTVKADLTPADIAAAITFGVALELQLGVGGVNQVVPLAVVAFATPYAPSVQFFDVPAETIQVLASVFGVSAQPSKNSTVTVTAMTAPHAEPGGVVQIRDAVAVHGDKERIQSADSEGMPRWMPAGFDDGEVRYRR